MNDRVTKPTVLVVDDEPRILDAIRDLLEENFEVVTTTDAHAALDSLSKATFAVILADQRMPGLTGDQFLAKARGISDATRILVTGYADITALIRAVNDGQIYNYVPKPWEPADLKTTVLKAASHTQELAEQKAAAETVARQQEALARSEAAFRQQTKLLQSILDSMADGVIVENEAGKMLLLNPAAKHMLGPLPAQVEVEQWAQAYGLYRPDMVTPYPADELPLVRATQGETVEAVELYVRNRHRPQGIFVSVNARPLRDDSGELRGGVTVVRDITSAKRSQDLLRRAKEEAERANHAKSEFLSRMSHELRTPLNSILGFAQLLEMDSLLQEQEDSVSQIMKSGRHLLGLINEVLDLARIEAGRLSISQEPVQVQDVIDDTMASISPMAQRQNITVIKDPTVDGEKYVFADRQRFKQVCLNLLSNAVKYTSEAGRINILCEERGLGFIRISVKDTGWGIGEEDRQRLFKPFERLGGESSHIEGTGLGLALSRGMMEAMGGSIGVESTLGRGSTFWIELPAVERPLDLFVAHEEKVQIEIPVPYPKICTVLYIEDNQANLKLMERITARRKELRLIVASGGQMGVDLAQRDAPDLILLDLHLPDIPGQSVLRQLKVDAATSTIPVVVLSADVTPGQIDRLLASGALSYLTKPLDVASTLRLFDEVFAPNNGLG
jgi:PAS domain S-box-containing protein